MENLILKLFVPFIFIILIVGCSISSDKIEKINIYKMKSFSVMEEDSLLTFSESKIINDFMTAFKSAKKVPGIVDMADPEFKVELGDKSYFLWISQESGTIMNVNDTNTIYTLSKSSVKTIYELLN
jgi:hypothetical protein